MATTNKLRLAAAALGAFGVAAALVAACSSNSSNPTPNTPVYTVPEAGDDGSSPTGPDGSTPDDSGVVTHPADGGTDGETEAQAPTCTAQLTDAGCWTCPAQTPTSTEFLNQCAGTGVHCSPFNNAASIPGYDGGPLVWSN
jgi:hypothetical protein